MKKQNTDNLLVLMVFIFTVLFVGFSNAEIITVEALVEIKVIMDNDNYFQGSVSEDDVISVIYSYDSETTPVEHLLHNEYQQDSPCGLNIELGNASFCNNSQNGYIIDIQNIFDPHGGQDMYILDARGKIVFSDNRYVENVNIDFLLVDYLHDAISEKELHIPNLSIWDKAVFSMSSENEFTVGGNIVVIRQIPEPSTILLLTIAIPFLRKKQ